MPTPQGLNTTTLHMKFVEPDSTGTPLQGTLTFTPNPSPILFPVQNIIVAGTETATLDVNGEATIELISTDQTGENPTGWLYSVTEKIIGQKPRSYNISLVYNGGVTVELADLMPSDAAPNYIPVVGPQGAPGVITTINGHSAATVNLVAADLPDLIPLAQKGAASGVATLTASSKHTTSQYDGTFVVLLSTRGAANGVASLDGTTKVPTAQIPDLSGTYVPWANVEVANGVASLDSSGKVKSTELNLASSAPPSVGTGAVGASTNLARQDHTHDGVDLVNTQTIGGAKTFSATATFNGTVVTAASIDSTRAANTSSILTGKVTSDTVTRVFVRADGQINWGPGNAATDVSLYRSNTGTLNISGQLWMDQTAPTAAGHVTRKDYVDGNFVGLTGTQTISGVKTFSGAPTFQQAAAGTVVANIKVTGDANSRFTVGADGTLSWGPGNAATDMVLYREDNTTLTTLGLFRSYRASTTNNSFSARVSGDTASRWVVNADGTQNWGPGGSTATDTNLYRTGVGQLKTDSIFSAQVQTSSSGTAASNFTVTSFSGRKTAGITTVYVSLSYTGSTITADSAGNIADTLCFTLPAGFIPPFAVIEAYDKSGTAMGDVFIDTDGTCKLKTLSPSATIASSASITFNATWVQ